MNRGEELSMEILKMARDIVNNEYTDKRAQDHNKWIAESDVAWKTRRVHLPYPTFPPFPTEEIIVARAKTLMQFLKNQQQDAVQKEPEPIPVSSVQMMEENLSVSDNVFVEEKEKQVQPLLQEEQKIPEESSVKQDDAEKQIPQVSAEEYVEMRAARRHEDESTVGTRVLPAVLKRIESIKKGWTGS